MAVKTFTIDGVGSINIYKRKGTRSLRLSIAADGTVKVMMPAWAPYDEGLRFVSARRDWIREHRPEPAGLLNGGQRIGKAHILRFVTISGGSDQSVRTRLAGSEIVVSRPAAKLITHPEVQAAARKACLRALRLEAAKLLPVRLRQLADGYGFDFASVQIKQLKGRWGSCDSTRHIVLNLYLMQLPWNLIDYVLVHELVHTKHLDHGPGFWDTFLRHEPRAKLLRRQIRKHQPVLEAVEAARGVT